MNRRIACYKILLVDDHPLVLVGMRLTLIRYFPVAEIEEARSAGESLAKIRARVPDVVLLDVRLPGKSGLDLLPGLLAFRQGMRVLMIAADVDPWTIGEALRAGAAGFIAKGCNPEVLCMGVEEVLRGGRFLCLEAQCALDRAAQGPGQPEMAPGPSVLSSRELDVLRHFAHGENSKMIGSALGISPKTVDSHKQHIQRKLRLSTITALVRYALRHELILD